MSTHDFECWSSHAFVLYMLVFVFFLFLLFSGVGCSLWLWHSLDFSINYFLYKHWFWGVLFLVMRMSNTPALPCALLFFSWHKQVSLSSYTYVWNFNLSNIVEELTHQNLTSNWATGCRKFEWLKARQVMFNSHLLGKCTCVFVVFFYAVQFEALFCVVDTVQYEGCLKIKQTGAIGSKLLDVSSNEHLPRSDVTMVIWTPHGLHRTNQFT